MAHYAAVASVVKLLDDIVYSSWIEFPSQGILESLFRKFSSLLDFLRDYSSKSGDEEAVAAARRIREVAYRTQEILVQRSNISNQISCWDEDDELVKLGEQLHSAMADLKKSLPDEEDLQQSSSFSSPTTSKLGTVPVVGLHHLVTEITDQLCGYYAPYLDEVQVIDELQGISIVGMSGIGKTTLARYIFESKSIVDQFDCRGWVTVSQNYNADKFMKNLLKCLGVHYYGYDGETYRIRKRVYKVSSGPGRYLIVDDGETERLRDLVRKVLSYRRYLIVVDDLWSKEAWDDLREIFPINYNRSRIVCTTQCYGVAHYVASYYIYVHKIPFLDEENSWILLKQMVNCPPELEFVGRLLATKCGGLPLAIAQLAQILSSNACTPEHWEHVAANVNTILGADDGGILFNALSRSYDQLTDQLKACFLYLGSFPDNCEISVSKLSKLWDAELIVKSHNRTLEQEAQKCLEELIQRNLVHIIKETTRSRIKSCKLHDVVRSFCRRKSCDENFLHATQVENEHIDIIAFDRCKLWRVLDIVEATPWSVLNAVVQMFHLKYLSLHLECPRPKLSLPPLPSSISMLQNLHTLIIHDPDPFPPLTLPPQIWKMTQLRHVIVTVMTLLPPIFMVSDTPVPKLEYLQTLSKVKDFIFTDEVIEMIPNLRKLKISFTGIDGNGRYMFCDHLDNLVHFGQLKELTIMVDPVPIFGFDSIWSNFTFPGCLTKLSIGGCKLPWEEMTMIGSLPKLQILKLRKHSFVGIKWVPIVGEFHKLRILVLERLDLKYWLAKKTHFRSLECLKIILCNDLKVIPFTFVYIPTLYLIEVSEGNISIQESAQQIKEEKQYLGFQDLQVVIRNYNR